MASPAPAPRTPQQIPSVLIVDDSAVARAVIARALTARGLLTVADAVPDAHAALRFLAIGRCDLILLDIEMPGMDGLTALPELIAASGGAKVLIVSSACGDGAAATIQALALGAADTLVKPAVGALAGQFERALKEKIWRLLAPEEAGAVPARAAATAPGNDFDLIAIGASTGGIHALSQLLRTLPATFDTPILITQHLPENFMPYFAAQLSVLSGRPAEVAADHTRIRPGRIFLAPGKAHLRVARTSDGACLRLLDERAESGCMPSVDPMLASAADIYGPRLLAIVLSGMGRDGAIGAAKVARLGGTIIVQDKASSVVWGMPGAIAEAGLANAIMPPAEIGAVVSRSRRLPC